MPAVRPTAKYALLWVEQDVIGWLPGSHMRHRLERMDDARDDEGLRAGVWYDAGDDAVAFKDSDVDS